MTSGAIPYLLSGSDPRLLIQSGIHGDEYETIELVEKCVEKYRKLLPDFLFIPKVSPSAVRQRSRLNAGGIDVNRNYGKYSSDPEVKSNEDLLSGYRFDLSVAFHEDVSYGEFYLYDYGSKPIIEDNYCRTFFEMLKSRGIETLTGVDDPNDSSLGYEFVDGYRYFPEGSSRGRGDFDEWAIQSGVVKKSILIEVPGKIGLERKREIVDLVFSHLILPECGGRNMADEFGQDILYNLSADQLRV